MKLKRRKIKRGRIEIIPMIDTIVILLIFYMTFSQFAEANKAKLNLPRSKAGTEVKPTEGEVIVNMLRDEGGELQVMISGRTFGMPQLAGELTRLKQLPEYSEMSIILRADQDLSYKDLSDFMKACARAKVADVSFTTVETKRAAPTS